MIRFAFGEHLLQERGPLRATQDAQRDLEFLAHYFSSMCGETYNVSLLSNLPSSARRSYGVLQCPSDQQRIVVEQQELTTDDCKQAQASLAGLGETAKHGLHQINRLELAAILREAIRVKLDANPLLTVESSERALLLRNRVNGMNESTYLGTALAFRAMPVEHGFLIARGRLLELW